VLSTKQWHPEAQISARLSSFFLGPKTIFSWLLPFCPAQSRKAAKADAKPISQIKRNQIFILVAVAAAHICPARSRKAAKADAEPISQVEQNQIFILVAVAAALMCPARSRKAAKADAEPISQVERNQIFILVAVAAAFISQTWL